jgi:hypothetical protein
MFARSAFTVLVLLSTGFALGCKSAKPPLPTGSQAGVGAGGSAGVGTGQTAGTSGAGTGGAGAASKTDAGAAGSSAAAADSGALSTECCNAHIGSGCSDKTVQDCVCKQVGSCCQNDWDVVCVELVGSLNCGSCKPDCCSASSSIPGCRDATVEKCVCAADATCCSNTWDAFCVTAVAALGCGKCM